MNKMVTQIPIRTYMIFIQYVGRNIHWALENSVLDLSQNVQ